MKTALLFFRNPDSALTDDYNAAAQVFLAAGFKADSIEILSLNDDLGFKRSLVNFKETADNLVVFINDGVTFNINDIIGEELNAPFAENENAKRFAEAVANSKNLIYKE